MRDLLYFHLNFFKAIINQEENNINSFMLCEFYPKKINIILLLFRAGVWY